MGSEPIGSTPSIIGYNMGTNLHGSNVASWVRYTGMNGARMRLNVVMEESGSGHSHVHSAETLAQAKEALRQSSEPQIRSLWKPPTDELPRWKELRRDGVEILATITAPFKNRSVLNKDGEADWGSCWELWRRYYAAAFVLAADYDVCRYQLFNEPDHSESAALSQPEYATRMRLGCDAIQTALADVNARGHRSLQPRISAPVAANMKSFVARQDDGDDRDASIGWGELSMRDRHRRWDGKEDAAYSQFQQYGFHAYIKNADVFRERLQNLKALVAQANGGEALPMVMSEVNVRTARDYAAAKQTLDSPSDYVDLGELSCAIASSGLEEAYFFRLTQSANLDGGAIKKNGTHYVSNDAAPYDIGGSTKGAEVIHLLMNGFSGRRSLLKVDLGGLEDLQVAACLDPKAQVYSLLLANAHKGGARTLHVDLSDWHPTAGDLLIVREVSEQSHGGVTQARVLSDHREVEIAMAPQSVALVSLYRQPGRPSETRARQGATVAEGAHAATHDASQPYLAVDGDADDPSKRLVAYLEFRPAPAALSQGSGMALLQLSANNPGNEGVPLHLYAFHDRPWDAWRMAPETAPHLMVTRGKKDRIAQRTVADVGAGVELIGTLWAPPGHHRLQAEVTRALQGGKAEAVTFLIVREPRFEGDGAGEQAIHLSGPKDPAEAPLLVAWPAR